MDPDFFWGHYNTGVAIGDISNGFAYENSSEYGTFVQDNSIYSIIDTGSTALMISALYFESLVYAIFNYAGIDDWSFSQGAVECSCSADLPSVYFQFDNAWIEAKPADYMFDYYQTGDRCILWILPTSMAMHILGMPVFVDYYSVHEPLTGAVHWAPHTNSPKDTIVTGPIPTGQYLTIGEVEQQSTVGLLIEYAFAAAACYVGIYYWQENVYTYLIVEENGYSEYVKELSGAYFLGLALVYYFALQPVYEQVAASATGTASASRVVSSGAGYSTSALYWAVAVLTAYLFVKSLKSKVQKKTSKPAVKEAKKSGEADLNELLNKHLNQLE